MMIAVIRLKGKRGMAPWVSATLESLSLNRLYTCTLLPSSEGSRGMVQSCKDAVSFGEVDGQAIGLLLSKRGLLRDGRKLSLAKKPGEIEKLAGEIAKGEKTLSKHGILPVFFLSPPRGGFAGGKKSQPPFGPLGRNPKIGALIAKMA
jgi:large subunit ribosomal protein L30